MRRISSLPRRTDKQPKANPFSCSAARAVIARPVANPYPDEETWVAEVRRPVPTSTSCGEHFFGEHWRL